MTAEEIARNLAQFDPYCRLDVGIRYCCICEGDDWDEENECNWSSVHHKVGCLWTEAVKLSRYKFEIAYEH